MSVMAPCLFFFPRTTAPEEPEEGPWQVSVVPAQADEVTAEHSSNTKVSPGIFICNLICETKIETHAQKERVILFLTIRLQIIRWNSKPLE